MVSGGYQQSQVGRADAQRAPLPTTPQGDLKATSHDYQPPFLPQPGLTGDAADPDPVMTAAERHEPGHHGVFPVTLDRHWHCGIHLIPDTLDEPVRAIADGEVVAYRVSENPVSDGHTGDDGQPVLNTNTGFVLLRHQTDTGDGRTLTYYSLYMNLLDLNAQRQLHAPLAPAPRNTSPTALAQWLLEAGDAVMPGGNRKVYRKDMLGLWGQFQDLRHLHFEIFMTEDDFSSWFESSGSPVQLGVTNPVQPTSKDWWGHAYFVIPGTVEFGDRPGTPYDDPWFPRLNMGRLPNSNSRLYVEAYFHKGERYMNAWLDENGDGHCVPLTREPVKDPCHEYEYRLYERATALYPRCPSDGYELLRFGRILSDHPTLTAPEDKATWVAVPVDASGTLSYVDVSRTSVIKLSDADFPFFTGWKKIDRDNAPVGDDGLFSYYKLRQLVGDSTDNTYPRQPDDPGFSLDDQLAYYVERNDHVRAKLSGLVCHAKSEWDPANNDERYGDLNRPDRYFGKTRDTDPDGYERFIEFVKKVQFMDQIPALSGGKKFWFFHPLAFIRHFRRCGWLAKNEFAQIYSDNHYSRHQQPAAAQLRQTYLIPLNLATRKYGLTSPTRLAHFLGQGAVESAWLTWWTDSAFISHNRVAMTKVPATIENPHLVSYPENCVDSGSFYLCCARPKVVSRIDQDFQQIAISNSDKDKEMQISREVTYAINGGYIGEMQRLEYTRLAKNILL